MRKLFAFALLCLFGPTLANAQILFFEDFDGHPGSTAGGAGTYSFPAGWVRINADNRTPNAAVGYVNNAWVRREDFANTVTDSAAFSTSWYSPVGQADDWMWTPPITLTANNTLLWEALAYDPAFRDGYEVRIWTSGGVPTAIPAQSTVLFSVAQENSTWTQRTVSLAAYGGQTVRIGFRNNSNDMFLLLIDNVAVFGPNDDDNCSGATPIPVGSTCNPMNFSNFGATDSGIAGCQGTADDDIWFSFVAPPTGAVNIQVVGSAVFDAVVESFSGTCNGLTSNGCADLTTDGGTETLFLSGLTSGQTYFVRVYDWYQGAAPTDNFTICITSVSQCSLTVPGGAVAETEGCGSDSNGGCNSGPAVYQNISCGQTVGGTAWASGTNRDTDWYRFTLATAQTVTVTAAAQFPFTLGFVNVASCTSPTFIANTSGSNCGVTTLSQALQPGTYAVVVLPSNFSNLPCGSGFNNYYVTLSIPPTVPTITPGGPTSFCQGGSVQLTSSPASSYSWSPSGGSASVMMASATGSYTVTVTDVNGCQATSAPVQVTVNQGPTAVLSGGGVACNGNGVNLTLNLTGQSPWNVVATNGVSQFPIANITSSPNSQSINIAGTYSLVSVADASGCPGNVSGSAIVTTGVTPTAAYTTVTNTLTANFTNNSTGGATSYAWTFGDGNTSILTSPSHTYSTAGSYTVCLTATNTCGSNQSCQQVTVSGPTTPPNDLCSNAIALQCGQSVNGTTVGATGTDAPAGTCNFEDLTGSAGVWYKFVGTGANMTIGLCSNQNFDTRIGIYTGTCGALLCVSANDNFCGTGASVDFFTAQGNNYFVYVTGAGGATGTFTLTHNLSAVVPVANAGGPTSFCQGNSVTLTSTPATSYSWLPTGDNGQSITVLASGSYTVSTVDFNGCQATSAPVQVSVTPIPTATLTGGGSACDGAGVDLVGNLTGTGPWNVVVSNGSSQFPITGITSSPYVQNVSVGGTYTVISVTDATGCQGSASGSATITAANTPVAGFTVQNLDPTVIFTDQSTGPAASVSWTFGDGGTSTLQSPVYSYQAPGSYTVCQTVTNICGTDQTCQTVDIVATQITSLGFGVNSVYPNPTQGQLSLQLFGVEAGSVIILTDLAGRTVANYPVVGEGEVKMNLDLALNSGTYLLRLTNKNGASKAVLVQVVG